VHASENYNDKKIVGGSFISASSTRANYIVEETTSFWKELKFGLDFPVYFMKTSGSDLYVGGSVYA
jgi:hypothetical protein